MDRFLFLLKSDLARVLGTNKSLCSIAALKCYFISESFKLCFWFRLGSYIATKKNVFFKFLLCLIKMKYLGIKRETGIQLPLLTNIGEGILFCHYSCIVIAQSVNIGKNVSLHQGVTIGRILMVNIPVFLQLEITLLFSLVLRFWVILKSEIMLL